MSYQGDILMPNDLIGSKQPSQVVTTSQPQSLTTIGALYCKQGVVMGADRRWSLLGNGAIPMMCGDCRKIQTYLPDQDGVPMFAISTTGMASVMEVGIPRLFKHYIPDYLQRIGISLQDLSRQQFYAFLKAFLQDFVESNSHMFVYRPQFGEQAAHLVTFRNKNVVCAFYYFAPSLVIPIESTMPFKAYDKSFTRRGSWATLGSGSVFFNSAMTAIDEANPLSQQQFPAAMKSMRSALYSAVVNDPYSNPGVPRGPLPKQWDQEETVDVRQVPVSQLDTLCISQEGVFHTPVIVGSS